MARAGQEHRDPHRERAVAGEPGAVLPRQRAGDADAGPARRPLFGWWTDQAGAVGGAFLHTPPHPLLLTAVPADVAADLAAALAGRPLRGVNGYVEAAEAFAAAWRAATPGGQVTEERRLRLYRLGELAWPDPAPDGAPRVAADADAPLLTGWFAAFADEVHDDGRGGGPGGSPCATSSATAASWCGRPAAGRSPSPRSPGRWPGWSGSARSTRRRSSAGHGYASAVTAEVSRRAREAGAEEVLLYTDLANPTSNSIYQRIGYRAVEDRVVLAFSVP